MNSLARPNGNTTGLSILATELDGKRQEILIEAVPGLRRMGALADSNVTAVAKLNELQEAARARKIELSIHQVTRGDQIATPSTQRTHPVLRRSMFWLHLTSSRQVLTLFSDKIISRMVAIRQPTTEFIGSAIV